MSMLLLSNLLSRPLKPIVILTDVCDAYIFYWLDGCTIFYCSADSPGIALGIIKSFLQQEVTAISDVQPVQVCSDVELPLIKRQRLDLEGQEYHDPRLDDLEDKSVDNEQSRAQDWPQC